MHSIQPDNRLQSLIRDDRADIIYKKGNYTNTYLMAEIDGLPKDEILYLGYLDNNDEFVQLYSPFDTNGHYRRTACTAYTPSSNSASQSLNDYFLDLDNYYFYQFDSIQDAGSVSQLNVTEEGELTITDNHGSQPMNQYSFSNTNHYTLDLYMKAPKQSIYNGKDFGIRIGNTDNFLAIFFGYYKIVASVNNNGEELFQSEQIVNAVDYTHIVITRDGNTFTLDYNDGEYVGTCEVNVDIENKLGFYDMNWGATNTIYVKDISVTSAAKNAIQLPAQYNADFSFWEDFVADSYDWVLHLPESNNFAAHDYPVSVDIVDFDTFEMVNSAIFPNESLTAKIRTYVNTIPESTDLLTTNATYDASTGIITYPPGDIDDLSVGEHTQLITGATNQLLTYTIKNPIEFFTTNNSDNAIYGTRIVNQYIGYTALTGELNINSYIDIKINGQSITHKNGHADQYHRYQSYKLPPGTYNYEVTGSTSTCPGLYTVTGTTHVVTTDCTLTLEDDATEQGAATRTNPRTLHVTYKWQNTPINNANIQVINLDNNSIVATGTTNNDGQISLSVTSGGTYQAQAIDYDNTILLSSTNCNITGIIFYDECNSEDNLIYYGNPIRIDSDWTITGNPTLTYNSNQNAYRLYDTVYERTGFPILPLNNLKKVKIELDVNVTNYGEPGLYIVPAEENMGTERVEYINLLRDGNGSNTYCNYYKIRQSTTWQPSRIQSDITNPGWIHLIIDIDGINVSVEYQKTDGTVIGSYSSTTDGDWQGRRYCLGARGNFATYVKNIIATN